MFASQRELDSIVCEATFGIKTCKLCKEPRPLSFFAKDKQRKDGLQRHCSPCIAASMKRCNDKQRDVVAKRNAEYYAKNKEAVRAYSRKWYKENKERCRVVGLRWKRANTGKVNAICMRRKAAKLERTPPWADLDAIKSFYEACPEGYEVDHIVPLQGDNVSGLHTLENLQYLTIHDNRVKSNNFAFIG